MTYSDTAAEAASKAEQIDRIYEVRARARADARLVRCQGSLAELRDYRNGSTETGWQLTRSARRRDLLISCVGQGKSRMVVSLCVVEGHEKGIALWDPATDVPVTSPVAWSDVMHAAGLPARAREMYDGPERDAVLDGLVRCIRDVVVLSDEEGEQRLTVCRERSRANREAKLAASDGSCEACGTNLLQLFPDRGRRALEVHHRVPLSSRPKGVLHTTLADLAVLCATCHRLVHADPDVRIDQVRARWLML